ncbi:AraC family transcriptional regulator [Pseudodesulfovibrio sp. zrk46]|uniref:AraC family transcriptional regulator n=1 Tax=Pseudodesulfovibrio sp. zrk46 TaxID=2725288 RepID=UPI0014490CDD|nr:AraC family transcriptional regulator [Pseudodesulfovibrio sp. zrk46]QJB58292.1 AraC family transcriptional regulator [Pseudodesulfovibrio sp. zrk46]
MSKQLVTYIRPPGLSGVELLHLADPDFAFGPHLHDAYVFWLNGQGGEKVSLRGASDILQPDSFGVVAPGEVHANHAVTESRTLQSLYVDEAIVEEIAAQRGYETAGFRSRLQQDAQSRTVLARLHAGLMLVDDAFQARELFVGAFSLLMDRHAEGGRIDNLRRDPAKVRLARTIIDEQYAEAIDLDLLAEVCGCSTCHLIRLFRREVGMTPHAYLMERRLAHTRDLLLGKDSLSAIALAAGFADQSHMTRRFRQRFGLTPGYYRRQISS